MKKYAMVISSLSIILCGYFIAPAWDIETLILIVINVCWLVVEMNIAQRQVFRNEVPRKSWILMSRIAWLCSAGFIVADVRWNLVAVSVPRPVRIAALALLGAGLIMRLIAYLQLGRYFTYDIRVGERQPLITDGIYSVVRHPAYCAICLLGSLPGLAAGSLTAFFLMTIFTLPQTLYRLNREEEMLQEMYGSAFTEYCAKSWRILPFLY